MSTTATLEVPADHPAFAGHFPNFPVLPGAALLDETLEIVCIDRGLDLEDWLIASAKFLSAVRPGEILSVEHEAAPGGQIRFVIRGADRRVASGSLARRDARGTAPAAEPAP